MRAPRGNIPSAAKAVSVLPLPDLPDHAHDLAGADRKAHVVDDAGMAPRRREGDRQIANFEGLASTVAGGSAMSVPQMRIKHIAQSVAQEIETENA